MTDDYDPNKIWTPREYADRARVAPHTVWRWIREGRLEAIRLSPRTTRITDQARFRFENGRG